MNPLDADEGAAAVRRGLRAAERGFARRPQRLFARLSPGAKPGDIVDVDGARYRVETAHVTEDLREAKCVLVLV